METLHTFISNAQTIIKQKFKYATFTYIFVMAFLMIIQNFFGASNSIVAIIFVQIMLSTSQRDTTGSPIKHFVIQTLVLMFMGIGSCVSVNLDPFIALPLNFIIMFSLLYAYTFEYMDSLYFPYILSYIFFVCLAPISYSELPSRLLLILVGAITMIAYQWFTGRHRIKHTSKSVLLTIIDEATKCIHLTMHQQSYESDYQKLRGELCKLSKLIYDRRKKALCICDAAFAMLDASRGLESLVNQVVKESQEMTSIRKALFYQIMFYLACFKSYVLEEEATLPEIDFSHLPCNHEEVKHTIEKLTFIRHNLLNVKKRETKKHYQKTLFSFVYRLKAALHMSQVRFVYACRVALLIALGLCCIQYFDLEHGRWLLFTFASVSLPYADDIKMKAKKRLIATFIGCAIGFVCFVCISNVAVRSIILTLSGYIMFYLTDYATMFSCATVGAIGGQIMSKAFGVYAIANIVEIRIFYIIIGVIIAYLVNVYFFPFYREKATRQLAQKYKNTSVLLQEVCQKERVDMQFYYNLVIQMYMQEDTLRKHAAALHWDKVDDFLEDIQINVRFAHCNEAFLAL